jgi:hypothetical protein
MLYQRHPGVHTFVMGLGDMAGDGEQVKQAQNKQCRKSHKEL